MGRADTFQTSIASGGSLHPSLQFNVHLRKGKCGNRNADISLPEATFLDVCITYIHIDVCSRLEWL